MPGGAALSGGGCAGHPCPLCGKRILLHRMELRHMQSVIAGC